MASSTLTEKGSRRRRVPRDPMRKASLWAGWMYIITFVSIPTLALYGPVKESGFIAGSGPDTGVLVGGILELIVGLAGIGTAVALFPVVKRQNESLAMGFVGTRVLEAAMIFAGVASLWTIVALRQAGAEADAIPLGDALAAFYDRAFLVGQSLMPVMNALLLGTLMFQSRLVPRWLPTLGFVGATVLLSYNAALLFGLSGQALALFGGLGVIPIATWEFGLGVYLVVKGFRPSAVATMDTVPRVPGTPWPGRFAPH
jgi:Domain of unknown function (DUF4386)